MKRHLSVLACLVMVVAMVFALASCNLFGQPEQEQPEHTHSFVDGKCECGESDPDYVAPECEHAYSSEVTKEANCTEAGEKKFTCTLCGESYTQEIAANGHTEEVIPGTPATCTGTGLLDGKKCTVCGVVTVEQFEIGATGHSFDAGKCTVCGDADPNYNGPKTYVFETNTVVIKDADGNVVATDKAEVPAGDTYVDGYFTIVGTVTQRIKDGAVYCVEIGKQDKGGIQFTVNGTATVEILFHSTSGSNTSWIGLRDADGNLITNNENVNSVTGTGSGLLVTYTLGAGTYTVCSPALLDDTGADPYNRTARVYSVKVTETPVEKNEIKVETTDTYSWIDEYTFTADAEGYYTFNLPAGLGFYSKAKYDSYAAPELDFYDNANGGTVVLGLEAGESVVFYVGAITKDTWTIEWTFEAAEIDSSDDPVTPPAGDVSELVVGSNNITLSGDDITNGKTFSFVVTEEGTYTFKCDFLAVVTDANGMQMGRGQVYLTAGTYNVTIVSMMVMPAGNYVVTVEYEAPASGEPDGSSEYPFVWETLPESVTFVSDTFNYVYYVFTSNVDGAVTFTWATEDSYFIYFELDADGNTTANSDSGYMKLSHTILVEAGKSYKVGLCTWMEPGETTIAISASSCNHVWSDATCSAPSTCANCGATTGDTLEHTSSGEATCSKPEVCTVCGEELSTAMHEMDETYVYATCTENGSYHGVCTVCGYEESEVLYAQGHSNWNMTCGDTGACMECGVEFTMEHDFTWGPATCTEAAYCSNCWQYVGEPLPHNYVDGVCTECFAEDPNYVAESYTVTGSGSLCGADWNYNVTDNDMILGDDGLYTKTFENVAAGKHEFKIIKNRAWADQGGAEYPSSNFAFFVVEEGSKVVITLDVASGKVGCYVYAPGSETPVVCDGVIYLVVGDAGLCGDVNPDGGDWGWEFENYANLLNLNADGKYEIVYTGVKAGEYGIKVVKNFSWDGAWGGTTTDNFIIKVEKDNSKVTVTFDPATGISCSVEAPHEHSYNEEVTTAPTCTAAGKATYTCACGDTYDKDIDATGHADENGDYKCDACSTKMLPADGTALTIPEAIAVAKVAGSSYSTQKYYITGIVTGLYNTTYGNFYIKDADGNEICIYGLYSADGKTRYDAMSYKPVNGDEVTVYTVLGTYNSDAQGKSAWLDEVVAHEHDYKDVVTEATCLYGGYTTHTCSICNGSYVDTEVAALGHTTENGTCDRCGMTVGGDAPAEPVTVSKTMKELITQYGWTSSTTKQSFNLDDVVSVKINGGSNTGKAYNGDHIRIYATDTPAGTITISVPAGYELVSVKISAQTGTYAFLNVSGVSGDVSNKVVEVSGTSVVLNSVKNGSDGKQVRVTAIEVVYQVAN